MNSEELRSIQAPIKEIYREQPESAAITLKASGIIGEGISSKLETVKAFIRSGTSSSDRWRRNACLFG